MRIGLDKTYIKISAYTILSATVIYLLYSIIFHLGGILQAVLAALGLAISVLSPLFIALVIVYLLHPLVSWIDAIVLTKIMTLPAKAGIRDKFQHLRRTMSVLITYLLVLSLIILIIFGLYILISGSLPDHYSLSSMTAAVTNYSNTYNELFARLITTLQTSGLSDNIKNQLLALVQVAQNFVGNAIAGIFTSLQRFGSNVLDVFLAFVIAFYILKDVEYFGNLYHESTALLFSRQHNENLRGFQTDINGVIAKFIRGQLLVALIIGVASSIALYIVGLDYAVLVGMTAGLCNTIPYFGPIIGSILAVVVALISGNPSRAVLAVIALLVVQQLDSTIISPRIVGNSVGLHPVFVILSIIIGGSLFGLLGMLIAVPTAGIIRLLLSQGIAVAKQRMADKTL